MNRREAFFWSLGLLLLALLFWKLRILDTAVDGVIDLRNIDLYTAHYPMTRYGFEALAAGRLPLWNPFALCGQPFLATYYTGLFYPANALYLVLPVEVGTEVSVVLHMLLAGAGTFALARRLGAGSLGALCGGLTYMWSGWLVTMTNQPTGLAAESWMPITLLLVDRVLEGRPRAGPWLALGVGVQLLIGAAEIFSHVLGAVAVLVAIRWVQQRTLEGARRVAWVALFGALGAGIAAAQLLPTVELVIQSTRSPGTLDIQGARWMHLLPPSRFLALSLESHRWLQTGVLAFVAFAFAVGRRAWVLWILGLVTAAGGALLAFGGDAYRIQFELLGGLFRGPRKFLDLYAFGQALLVAAAVSGLGAWCRERRGALWRHAGFALGTAVAAALVVWTALEGAPHAWLAALLVLLLAFGALPPGRGRRTVWVGIAALQGVSLFFGSANTLLRPLQRPPDFFETAPFLVADPLHGGGPRTYISPALGSLPGTFLKQGLIGGFPVSTDYEPLSVGRYADFFGLVTPWRAADSLFNGRYALGSDTRWDLMDLTGTRSYAVRADEALGRLLPARPGFSLRATASGLAEVVVYRRSAGRARARFVPEARVLPDDAAVLAALAAGDFAPSRETLIVGARRASAPPPRGDAPARVRIEEYAPERVVVAVKAASPGYLVLSDLYYPGWIARVNGEPRAIQRADYLFRAVRVDAGEQRVVFEYRPASVTWGFATSATSALVLVAALALCTRRRGPEPRKRTGDHQLQAGPSGKRARPTGATCGGKLDWSARR